MATDKHHQAVEEYFSARPESADPARSGGYGANFLANLADGATLGAHPPLPPSSWKSRLIEELAALTRNRADRLGKSESVTVDDVPAAIWELRSNGRKSVSYPDWTKTRWFPDHVGATLATIRPARQLADLVDVDDDLDDVLAPRIRDTLKTMTQGAPLQPWQLDRLIGFGPFPFRLRPNAEIGGRQLLWFSDESTALGCFDPTEPSLPATALRDALGLVHYRKNDSLVLVLFPAACAATALPCRPCAFDAVGHRRFMLATSVASEPVSPGPWGQAAHLRMLEEEDPTVIIRDGFDGGPERISRPLTHGDLGNAVLTARVLDPVEVTRGGSGSDVEFVAYLERTMAGISTLRCKDGP